MNEVTLTCIIKKEIRGGYSAICPELDVASRGDTIEEAKHNLQEAVEGHIKTAQQEGLLDEIFELLGINKKDLKKKHEYTNSSFSSPLTVPLPA